MSLGKLVYLLHMNQEQVTDLVPWVILSMITCGTVPDKIEKASFFFFFLKNAFGSLVAVWDGSATVPRSCSFVPSAFHITVFPGSRKGPRREAWRGYLQLPFSGFQASNCASYVAVLLVRPRSRPTGNNAVLADTC